MLRCKFLRCVAESATYLATILAVAGYVTLGAMFRPICLAMALRHKLRETLHTVTALRTLWQTIDGMKLAYKSMPLFL